MVPSFRDLAPRLLFAGVLPLTAYHFIRPHVSSDAVGLAIIMVFPLLEVAFERRKHGRIDPIGAIVLTGIGLGLIGAVALHGNAELLKLRESMVTGAFGVINLVSLLFPKPVMWFLGRAIETGGDDEKVKEFNATWDLPGVAHGFRVVTAVWGVVLVIECAARVALSFFVSTERFLAISPPIAWATIGLTIWWTAGYTKRRSAEVQAYVAATADPAPIDV